MSLQHASLDAFRLDRIPVQHVQEAVEAVAEENGFKKPRFDVRPGSKAGDNYGSLIYRVGISDASDSGRTLSVIVKSPLSSRSVESLGVIFKRIFINEINAYTLVFPAFAKMLQERKLLPEGSSYPGVPRFFKGSVAYVDTGSGSVVLLQDMRPEGFVMHDRRQPLDLQHCRLVLEFLANFHASSFAMQRQHPEAFFRLKNSQSEVFVRGEDIIHIFKKEPYTKSTLEMIEKRFPRGSPEYEAAEDFCATAEEDLLHLITPFSDGGNVLCHGDCWLNNLLFKYSDEGRVESVCVLDFQVMRFCSPVLDVVHFLFGNTDGALRREHLDSLLREYHGRLQARMRQLGLDDPDADFSWERLQRHLRERGRFGFIMGLFIIPALTVDDDGIPEMAKQLEEDGAEIADALAMKCSDPTERDRRASDLLQDIVERGYFRSRSK